MGKAARVPFAAYATATAWFIRCVAVLGVAGVTTLAIGVAEVACLPDADRTPIDAQVARDATSGACGDGFIDPAIDGSPEECDPGSTSKSPGCSPACRVECDGGVVDPLTKHCYFRVQPNDSERNARGNCNGGHVVTFASDDEVAFLADAGLSSGFWVGLTYDVNLLGYGSDEYLNGEPGWIYPEFAGACPGCYARTGSDASTYFPPLGPDAGIMPECVYASSLTAWHHSPCSGASAHDTLCEREPPGSRAAPCNGGICITVAQTQGKKRYLFVPSDTTADDAKTSCESLGGSLVLFDTREEREQLSREIAVYTGKEGASFWVGLAANDGGAYVWDDGKPESTRPSLSGIDAGVAGIASSAARVFVSLRTTDAIDRGLGHADVRDSLHTYVCQY